MRFDDTLETVLAADTDTAFAAQSAWRQVVDLVGRRRVPADARALARLVDLRDRVPLAIRVASARMLEQCEPPAPLIGLFATDDLAVGLPVLRTAALGDEEWQALLPQLSPPARSVLRNRRDLSPVVRRALEAFGHSDMAIGDDAAGRPVKASEPDILPQSPTAPSFVSLGSIALGMPVVAEAVRRAAGDEVTGDEEDADTAHRQGQAGPIHPEADSADGPFRIADVVARIDAFQRRREESNDGGVSLPSVHDDRFRFETDRFGTIHWVEGINRAVTIGLALAAPGVSHIGGGDAIIAGALRRRAGFRDARLAISGSSDAAGDWLLSAVPVFDTDSGRFTGYRGTARRPLAHERAEPSSPQAIPVADSMRQLVHELRTPANAISGFAEMIGSEMLGPVPPVYRERANVIRDQARILIAAIDDLDFAARIEGNSLDLRPQAVAVAPLLAGIVQDLSGLLDLRGAAIDIGASDSVVSGDARALERLFGRLFATLAASTGREERVGVAIEREGKVVRILIDRPATLAVDIADDDIADAGDEALSLGTSFALRLAANLARELGGSFDIGNSCLTLQLPAAEDRPMERTSRL